MRRELLPEGGDFFRGGRAGVEPAGGVPVDHAAGEELAVMNDGLPGRRHGVQDHHRLHGYAAAGHRRIENHDMRLVGLTQGTPARPRLTYPDRYKDIRREHTAFTEVRQCPFAELL
jgi:hypothetical protein